MAGVGRHLWVLGVAQGAPLGLITSSVVIALVRCRFPLTHQRSADDHC